MSWIQYLDKCFHALKRALNLHAILCSTNVIPMMVHNIKDHQDKNSKDILVIIVGVDEFNLKIDATIVSYGAFVKIIEFIASRSNKMRKRKMIAEPTFALLTIRLFSLTTTPLNANLSEVVAKGGQRYIVKVLDTSLGTPAPEKDCLFARIIARSQTVLYFLPQLFRINTKTDVMGGHS